MEEQSSPSDTQTWQLAEYGSTDERQAALGGSSVTLRFDDGRVVGSAGCNRYFGTAEVDGSRITIGPVGSTQMMCPDPEVMEQEIRYLALLSGVDRMEFEADSLRFASEGEVVLVFTTGDQNRAG